MTSVVHTVLEQTTKKKVRFSLSMFSMLSCVIIYLTAECSCLFPSEMHRLQIFQGFFFQDLVAYGSIVKVT